MIIWISSCRCEERRPCSHIHANDSGAGRFHVGLCSYWSYAFHCGKCFSHLHISPSILPPAVPCSGGLMFCIYPASSRPTNVAKLMT